MPVGGATKLRFQNESMPAPPMKGLPDTTSIMFILPNASETASPIVLAEVDAREVEGVGAVHPGKVERGVDRYQHAAAPVDAVAEVVLGVNGHRETVPEAQLVQIGIDEHVGLAAVFEAVLAFAGREPLVELGEPGLDRDALLLQRGSSCRPSPR